MIEMANESQAKPRCPVRRLGANPQPTLRSDGDLLPRRFRGNLVGTTKVSRTIELGPDGKTFQHIAPVGVSDVSDHLVSSLVARASGVRMPIERISDVP
jgi:hypothetical protein